MCDFQISGLMIRLQMMESVQINNNSVSNSANAEPDKKRSKYENNVQKYTVMDAVDLVLDKYLSLPEDLRVTFDLCMRQNLYHAVKKWRQSICDGEHVGKLVAASDTQISRISSLSPKSKKSRKSVKHNNKCFIEEKLKR